MRARANIGESYTDPVTGRAHTVVDVFLRFSGDGVKLDDGRCIYYAEFNAKWVSAEPPDSLGLVFPPRT